MITLYGPAQAPFTEKVRRALIYKGIEFELREPRTLEDYKRWSPKTGMLPVLDIHGERIPDSTDILLRLEASGAPDRILSGQRRLLSSLIDETRIDRMSEHAERPKSDPYLPVEMMEDLTNGIWSELGSMPVEIDLYRRNLQRAHVDILADQIGEEPSSTSDLPALARGELTSLLGVISYALDGNVDGHRVGQRLLDSRRAEQPAALRPIALQPGGQEASVVEGGAEQIAARRKPAAPTS